MSTLSGIAQQVVNQNRQRLANPISISHQREFTYSINLHHDTRSDNLRRSPFKALRNQRSFTENRHFSIARLAG
jgi:hypothetical protein